MKNFDYHVHVAWVGNDGHGTNSPKFDRANELSVTGKPTLVGSAPAEFGGDGKNWAPEDLLVAAVSQCHMLTYLFLCSRAGIVVESYEDDAVGHLEVEGAAGGQFREIELRPAVSISSGDPKMAEALHADASAACYIGRTVQAPIRVSGTTAVRTS
jgi:organic hydroperoxide reductase OsmC/OhrA